MVLEDYPFKFSIVEPERYPLDWKKLGEPRNWVKQGVKIGRVLVEKHGDKSVVIHTGRRWAFSGGRKMDSEDEWNKVTVALAQMAEYSNVGGNRTGGFGVTRFYTKPNIEEQDLQAP